jgi:hypothetical protein
MWVFDGEEWTEEGVSRDANATKPGRVTPRLDEMQPELQIVEIVPLPPLPRYIPMPLP